MPAAVSFVFSFYILKTICVNSMGIFFEKADGIASCMYPFMWDCGHGHGRIALPVAAKDRHGRKARCLL